jgi:DMSO reductase anchor subunit
VYAGVVDYALIAGFVFVALGLLSSVAHLGKPARAWRALSQWRSSWLSREGAVALLTFIPAALIFVSLNLPGWRIATGRDYGMLDWLLDATRSLRWLGVLLAFGAFATVFCTANIYASLKPVRAWRNRFVTSGYLLLGLYSGALLMWVLATLPQAWFAKETPFLLGGIAVLAAAGAVLKVLYWRDIDALPPPDAGHATGLDAQGAVRTFEQPHTEENYLTREMGFVLARRHANPLRRISLVAGFLVPGAFALAVLAYPRADILAWIALAFGFVGVFVERWLFFAEAKHAVIGYYAR